MKAGGVVLGVFQGDKPPWWARYELLWARTHFIQRMG